MDKPDDVKMMFIGEEKSRWQSFEYFLDEDGDYWVRFSMSSGSEQTVKWFKEGFDIDECRVGSYYHKAEVLAEILEDKFNKLNEMEGVNEDE